MSAVTIKETRNLLLPLDTVLEALLHFDRASHGTLSRGEVLQADFVSGGPAGAGIDVAVRMEGDVVEWQRFNFTAIAAAIISYCRSKRIPLPYSGVKSLELTKDGIAFHIENTVSLAHAIPPRADLSGRPLRYAKGYEPHAIVPSSHHEALV
jgi:hypothetical protein